MLHLYCGEGKGKTSAAMGLALRMAGRGRHVVIAQFLKGADSGERLALGFVPGVELLGVPERVKFSFLLSPREREAERLRYGRMLEELMDILEERPPELLVLDEICAAVGAELVPLEDVLALLDKAKDLEVVLTGRDPPPEFLRRADYLTRMEKFRHPYDRGISAREGVEY